MTITTEVLIKDIENTKKELKAYRMIIDGFRILSNLPENDPEKFRIKIMKYVSNALKCSILLDKLQDIYDRRMRNE